MHASPVKDLPVNVITALLQGKKIEAIKLLRESQGLDLKASKGAIDQYVQTQPALERKLAVAQAEANRGCLPWLVLVGGLAAAGYYLFRHALSLQ